MATDLLHDAYSQILENGFTVGQRQSECFIPGAGPFHRCDLASFFMTVVEISGKRGKPLS